MEEHFILVVTDFQSGGMTDSASLLKQLDESMSQGSNESRLRALWHATDVLISGQYSEQDIWTFGEVIGRLTRGIKVAARTELARRLAHSGNAPIDCIKRLAADASIDESMCTALKSHRPPVGSEKLTLPVRSDRAVNSTGVSALNCALTSAPCKGLPFNVSLKV